MLFNLTRLCGTCISEMKAFKLYLEDGESFHLLLTSNPINFDCFYWFSIDVGAYSKV